MAFKSVNFNLCAAVSPSVLGTSKEYYLPGATAIIRSESARKNASWRSTKDGKMAGHELGGVESRAGISVPWTWRLNGPSCQFQMSHEGCPPRLSIATSGTLWWNLVQGPD